MFVYMYDLIGVRVRMRIRTRMKERKKERKKMIFHSLDN